jgi:perosamine synthetase
MLKTPKQIIYPINYLSIIIDFLIKKKINYKKFIGKFRKFFFFNNQIIFLGRARSGIYLAVKILINSKKPIVLLSPYTIPDVVNMVICAGGTPVFVDFIKETTYLNIKKIRKNHLKRASILILTHYNIDDPNISRIYKFCKINNLRLVEDCAISIKNIDFDKNKKKSSDVSVFSFSSFKYLNFFYGGLIQFKHYNDYIISKKIVNNWVELKFINYFRPFISTFIYNLLTSKYLYPIIFFFTHSKINLKHNLINRNYIPIKIGEMDKSYFSKPADSFFNELDRKVNFFPKWEDHRKKISLIYFKHLRKISIPNTISANNILKSSCYNYLIKTKNKKKLRLKLAKKGFDTGYSMYPNSHTIVDFRKIQGQSDEVENLINNSITLPTHHRVTAKYANDLSKSILSSH